MIHFDQTKVSVERHKVFAEFHSVYILVECNVFHNYLTQQGLSQHVKDSI